MMSWIDLENIWKEMEQLVSPSKSRKIERRIYPETTFDIYITLEKPSNLRALQLDVAQEAVSGISDIQSTRVLTSQIESLSDQKLARIKLELTDVKFAEVFTILVDDLSKRITSSSSQKAAVKEFILRLNQWILFLEHSGPDGLTSEAQKGLYGELWFLKNYLLNRLDHTEAISSWTGSDATPQDFQLSGTAVEVKVTTAKLPQHLLISNELQLDDTAVETLLLLHMSLDARKGSGESLIKIIDSIRKNLHLSTAAQNLFELNLLQRGYHDNHRKYYDQVGYFVLDLKFFHVIGDFPRLTNANLPAGIGNIRYSIEISACVPYVVNNEYVISTILKDI